MLIERQLIADQNILYTLRNKNGISVKVLTYGGIITHLSVPDRNNKFENIVLGYDDPEVYLTKEYIDNCPYFGAIVGRFANRIANAQINLNNQSYKLSANNGQNHLHGGKQGFDKVCWKAKELKGDEFVGLELTYLSKDGEEGYPGNLTATVTYLLTNSNKLKVVYEAETDKTTPVNLTNHTYFNLTGGKSDILGHELQINAENYTVFDKNNIPTGEIRSVKETFLDFTNSKNIGDLLGNNEIGYDHNFVLNRSDNEMVKAANLFDPVCGRRILILTTKPGIQLYTANFFNKNIPANNSRIFKKYYGLCLETQYFPDSPNQKHFPDSVLNPGEKYSHTTEFEFLVD